MIQEQDLLDEIQSFSPLAPSLLHLAEVIASDDYTIAEVEQIVRVDTALTIDTLRYANSVENVGRSRVATVQDAIVRLGGERLFRYLYALWLVGIADKPLRSYGLDANYFWVHGITVAMAYEALAKARDIDSYLAFTSGLLHDIGKITLNNLAEKFKISMEIELNSNDFALMNMEKEIFGINHRQMGVTLMKKWGFPDELIALANDDIMLDLAHEVTDALSYFESGVDISDFSPEVQKIAQEVSEKRVGLLEVFGIT